ncbi:Nn.00g059060.m01.CDS01 [Neocucurbitaria sp. VM-36]
MKLSFFLSASATSLLVAAAATDGPSLAEALKNFKNGKGIDDLGRDGVLRSLNPAHDTVIDYVQLSEGQIAQFLGELGIKTAA